MGDADWCAARSTDLVLGVLEETRESGEASVFLLLCVELLGRGDVVLHHAGKALGELFV